MLPSDQIFPKRVCRKIFENKEQRNIEIFHRQPTTSSASASSELEGSKKLKIKLATKKTADPYNLSMKKQEKDWEISEEERDWPVDPWLQRHKGRC